MSKRSMTSVFVRGLACAPIGSVRAAARSPAPKTATTAALARLRWAGLEALIRKERQSGPENSTTRQKFRTAARAALSALVPPLETRAPPADVLGMSTTNQHVFSHGMRDTRETFELWNDGSWAVLRGWLALSVAIALTLLGAVWFVSGQLTPDISPIHLPGLTEPSSPATCCHPLAELPGAGAPRDRLCRRLHRRRLDADRRLQRTGISRWIHVKAGELAIVFVSAVDAVLALDPGPLPGLPGSTLAYQLQISGWRLILSVLPHALIELTALFLPLAAWLLASRKGEWNQLLAATLVTVMLAIPALIVAATIEVYVWPHILHALSPGLRTHLLALSGRRDSACA